MPITATVLPKTDSLIRLRISCPFCGFPFNPGDHVVFCPLDNTPHHAVCWHQNGNHCTLLGCTGAGEIVIPTAVTLTPAHIRRSIVPFLVSVLVTMVIVALLTFWLVNKGTVPLGPSSPFPTSVAQLTSTPLPTLALATAARPTPVPPTVAPTLGIGSGFGARIGFSPMQSLFLNHLRLFVGRKNQFVRH